MAKAGDHLCFCYKGQREKVSLFAEAEVLSALHEVNENDPDLLRSLNEAITQAETAQGLSADEVRARVLQWTFE